MQTRVNLFKKIYSLAILLSIFQFGFSSSKIPVIVITDLYHPAQDVGDNFDIITPYALPEIDLKCVIFDVTEKYRKGANNEFCDPGYICVNQLNYIFNRNIQAACSPFFPMRSVEDKMYDIPLFQQQGLNLFFKILSESRVKVQIVSTGSARLLAVAYNRNPKLMKTKIDKIHFCAGATSDNYKEWNIELDTLASYRLLKSDLPICIYPCATENGPFDKGINNTFWCLNDINFIFRMDQPLQKYLAFAFLRKCRMDYLNYIEQPLCDTDKVQLKNYNIGKTYAKHYVWETAIWEQVSGRKLAKHKNGQIEIIPVKEILPSDSISNEGMRPCVINTLKSGLFSFKYTNQKSNFSIYYRADPNQNQNWLQKALPNLYISYKSKY